MEMAMQDMVTMERVYYWNFQNTNIKKAFEDKKLGE